MAEKRNGWKTAFIVLSMSMVVALSALVIWVTMASTGNDNNEIEPESFEESDGASFTITTTKEDVNKWLQTELPEETGTDELELYIDDAVYMETVVEALNISIPIEMTLSPQVTSEGNLELKEESFTVGNISLPSGRVLELVDSRTELPDWLTVVPQERTFNVNVRNGVSDEVDIRIEAFDLEANDIKFEVTIPDN